MNTNTTRWARGVKCGARGASGPAALELAGPADEPSASRAANAMLPNPPALRASISRRDRGCVPNLPQSNRHWLIAILLLGRPLQELTGKCLTPNLRELGFELQAAAPV